MARPVYPQQRMVPTGTAVECEEQKSRSIFCVHILYYMVSGPRACPQLRDLFTRTDQNQTRNAVL